MKEYGFSAADDETRRNYYETLDSQGLTLAASISNDLDLFNRAQFDINRFQNFLLAGCASPTSLSAMESFVFIHRGDQPTNLFVSDISSPAITLLKNTPPHITGNINRSIVQSDLSRAPFASGTMNYIRMDYLQNFLPAEKQQPFIEEMKRILAQYGFMGSVVNVVNAFDSIKEEHQPPGDFLGSGFIFHEKMGFHTFIPTKDYLMSSAQQAGFGIQIIPIVTFDHLSSYIKEHPEVNKSIETFVDTVFVVYQHLL